MDVEIIKFFDNENVFDASKSPEKLDDFLAKIEVDGPQSVCFTGSRPASLPWGYNEECELFKEFWARLKVLVDKLFDHGFVHFISGMALGFDTYAAEAVLNKKDSGAPVFLECALPFEAQSARWSNAQKSRYDAILRRADKISYVSNQFDKGCYSRRNEYMVKNSSLVVALQLKPDGGTASTIKYAKKHHVPIIMF